jgi:hypothetical protein
MTSNLKLLASIAAALVACSVSLPCRGRRRRRSRRPGQEEQLHEVPLGHGQEGRPLVQGDGREIQGQGRCEAKLVTHLTTNPKIKIDGKEEEHDNLKTKNDADVRNVVQWILSQ